MSKPRIIFVDADAFVALTKKDDSNHKKAKEIFEQLFNIPVTFTTSNYVFSEVATVLSQRVDHHTAVAFIHSMKAEGTIFQIERISEELEESAIEIFMKQKSKNVSFVDCTNIAVIRAKHMDGIFSFDDAYKKNGVQFVEALLKGVSSH